MLVVAKPDADDWGGAGRECGVAEVVVLVFGLGGPVRREHVFEACAHGVAVAMIAVGRESRRHAADADVEVVAILPAITALGVKQRRAPGVAEATGDRSKLVAVGGHENAAGEQHAIVAVAEPGVLGFDTDNPARGELIIGAALHATEEAAVVAVQAIVASESAADMSANIEAGPVVDRLRDVRGSLGIGTSGEIGCECWHGRAESDEGHSTE